MVTWCSVSAARLSLNVGARRSKSQQEGFPQIRSPLLLLMQGLEHIGVFMWGPLFMDSPHMNLLVFVQSRAIPGADYIHGREPSLCDNPF